MHVEGGVDTAKRYYIFYLHTTTATTSAATFINNNKAKDIKEKLLRGMLN